MLTKIKQKIASLKSEDTSRNVKNAAFSTGDFLVNALVLLAATPVYLKGLGTELFGVWILVNTVLGMGGMFSFGMGQATLKFVSKYHALGDSKQVIATIRGTWGIYLSLGILGGLAIAAASPILFQHAFTVDLVHQDTAIKALALAGLGLPVIFSNNVFDCSLKGFERYDYASNANVVVNVLRHATQVICVLSGYGIVVLVAVAIASQLIGVCVKAFLLRRKLLPDLICIPSFTHSNHREIFSFSFYSWLSNLMGIARNNGDRLIIASMLGASALAYYDIAQRILVQVYNVTSRAFGFLFPYSSRLYESGRMDELRKNYDQATAVISVLSIACILPLFVFAHPILEMWLGAEVALQASFLMQILAVRFALYPLSIVNTYFLYGANKIKSFALIQAISTVFMLGAVALLTSKFGLIGSALGQCCVIFVIFFNRTYIENSIFGNWRLLPHVIAVTAVLSPILIASTCIDVVGNINSVPSLFVSSLIFSIFGVVVALLIFMAGKRIKPLYVL